MKTTSTSAHSQPPTTGKLKPVSQLSRFNQLHIQINRLNHPGHTDQLGHHLAKLGLPELADYLVWIPYERFVEMEMIGRGGFSVVYKAKLKVVDPRGFAVLKRGDAGWQIAYDGEMWGEYALKEVHPALIQELILSTYLAFCGVSSSIGLIGLSYHSGKYLMVMDYAEEGSLEQRSLNGPIPTHWDEILALAQDMAGRLYLLHQYGLTHNDLHPGNVVFRTKSFTKKAGLFARLIDIGLSRAVEGMHEDDEDGVYGRLPYLPPEVFERQPYTKASDVYCLATLLWQLAVGVMPDKTAAWAVKERGDGLREEMIPGAPQAFTDLLRNCWDPDPRRRLGMAEVVWRLHTVGDVQPIGAETISFIESRKKRFEEEMRVIENDDDLFEFYEGRSLSVNVGTTNLQSQFHAYETIKVVPGHSEKKAKITVSPVPTTVDNPFSILATINSPTSPTSPTFPAPDSNIYASQSSATNASNSSTFGNLLEIPTTGTTRSSSQSRFSSRSSSRSRSPSPNFLAIPRYPPTQAEYDHRLRLIYLRGVPNVLIYDDLRQCLYDRRFLLQKILNTAFVADSIAEFCVYEDYARKFAMKMEELGFRLLKDYDEACSHDMPARRAFLGRWDYIARGRRIGGLKVFARDLVREITEAGKVNKVVEAPDENVLADETEFPALRAVH